MNTHNIPAWHVKRPSLQEIIASKIVAKTIVKKPDTHEVTIIVAFQLSYEYAYWFFFRAPSSRTARKNWKYLCHKPVAGYMGETQDLEKIVKALGDLSAAKVTRKYVIGKKNFLSALDRIAHPTKYIVRNENETYQTEYVNQRNATKWGG